jgi:hypothetical protein
MQTTTQSSTAENIYLAIRALAYLATAAIAVSILYGAWTTLKYWSGIGV